MKVLSRLKLTADDSWFDSLTEEQKKGYIKEHPGSKYAKKYKATISPERKETAKKELKKLVEEFMKEYNSVRDKLAPGLKEKEALYYKLLRESKESKDLSAADRRAKQADERYRMTSPDSPEKERVLQELKEANKERSEAWNKWEELTRKHKVNWDRDIDPLDEKLRNHPKYKELMKKVLGNAKKR